MSKPSSAPWTPLTAFTSPEVELGGDLVGDTASRQGWWWAQPGARHSSGLARDREAGIDTASRGKEGQGRQSPASARAWESASPSASPNWEQLFPGPPRRRGGPARGALCLAFQKTPFRHSRGVQIGNGRGWSVEAGEGAQTSQPRNINPPSISGQGGGAEGGEGGAAQGTHKQPGGTGRASPLSAALRGDTDTQTSTHTPAQLSPPGQQTAPGAA